MNRTNEKGVALVITLFLMASLSALAVSLMFLSQTETSASRNYKTMSQARYAGEAGIHKALNYLMSDGYVNTVAGSYSSLTTNTYPVQYNSADVILSSTAGSSNYPDTTAKSDFAALFTGSAGQLAAGTATLTYTARAKLLSVQPVNVYGGSTKYIQTWEINATGTVPGPMPATVEVTAILERDAVPAQTYAIFATGSGCGAIDLDGTSHTDSYNSSDPLMTHPPTTEDRNGGVGTNGNLSISGHVRVNGNLDTPRTGVGECEDGTPTALSDGGSAEVGGSIVPLPQPKVYEAPAVPTVPTGSTAVSAGATWCLLTFAPINPAPASCAVSGNTVTIRANGATLQFGNLSVASNTVLNIEGSALGGVANINVNSLALGSNAQIKIGTTSTVVMNVRGEGVATPIDVSGGGFANPSFDPSRFQILYAGTGQIELIGGNEAAVSIYAPNAAVRLNGNADIFGSVLCKTYKNGGSGSVHYDTALASKFITLGNFVLSSFSWKKY